MFYKFFPEYRIVYEIRWKKLLHSRTGRKLQYGLYALHAVYLSLQTHTQNM